MTDWFHSLLHLGSPSPEPPLPHGEMGVLVVDDEDGIRRFVERALRASGYAPVMAASGPAAIAAARGMARLDLLLTDMMMPDMNGEELAGHLRARQTDLRVLYLTGYSDRLFAEKAILKEGEAFLDKPCTIAGLHQAVELITTGRIAAPPAPAPELVAVGP